MNKIILRENIDEKFGYSLVTSNTDQYYLPIEIFGLVKLKDCVPFLESTLQESYFQFSEVGGFIFGSVEASPFDGIEALSDNEVEIGVNEEVIRISKREFLQYCSDFGHKAIEAVTWFKLEKHKLVDSYWVEKIISIVKRIDQKIKDLH